MVVQTAISSVPHSEAETIIFPCSVISSDMVPEVLSSCPALSLRSIWTGTTLAVQADAKGKDVPKIARYKVHSLEETIHPCLKSPYNWKAEIKLIASCCFSVKKLPTTKWPEKNPFELGIFQSYKIKPGMQKWLTGMAVQTHSLPANEHLRQRLHFPVSCRSSHFLCTCRTLS